MGYLKRLKYENMAIQQIINSQSSASLDFNNCNPITLVTKISRNLIEFIREKNLDILIKAKKSNLNLEDKLIIDQGKLKVIVYHILMNCIEASPDDNGKIGVMIYLDKDDDDPQKRMLTISIKNQGLTLRNE